MTIQEFDMQNEIKMRDFLSSNLGVQVTERIYQGHIGLPIYRGEGANNEKLVVKIGAGQKGKREVDDNLFGYTKMRQVGAGLLVPDSLSFSDTPWGPALIMQDLGSDFRVSSVDPETTRNNLNVLRPNLITVFQSSLRDNVTAHVKGVEEVHRQLKKWLTELEKGGLVDRETVERLDTLDPQSLTGPRAAAMLLDFTPDNIFIHGKSAKFIDPWRQEEYLGTPIPGISQFVTLAEHIYHISGFTDGNLQYTSFIEEVGLELLGLTPKQLEAQINLGRTLQYALSSFVRMAMNPELAKTYANSAQQSLSLIT